MIFTGKLTRAISMNMQTFITFESDVNIVDMLGKYKDKKLTIEFKQHYEKRSQDANAYFHALNTKIAEALGISQNRCKNILLSRYGQLEYIDGKIPTYLIKSQYDDDTAERSDIHFKPIGYECVNDESFTKYAVIRGSHTYNTKEMASLIDGTVNEAKDQEIDTLPPDELRQMKERWGV